MYLQRSFCEVGQQHKLVCFIIVFQSSPWETILTDSVVGKLLKMKFTGENPNDWNSVNVKSIVA